MTRSGAGRARIRQRREQRLDLLAQVLEVRRQRQALAQSLERLVGREPGADGRDLEQDAARLAEVDRLEVEAVDDGRRRAACVDHPLSPGLVLLGWGGPRDVVDRAGARDAALVGAVVDVGPAPALT